MKMTPRSMIGPVAAAAALALTTPATLAQSELWTAARERLESLQAGKSPKSTPVRAEGAVEQWGEPMPSRGISAEERAVERIRGREAKTGASPPPVRKEQRREQLADERGLDDRGRDERNLDERATRPAPRTRATAVEDIEEPTQARARAVAPKVKAKGSVEERLYGKRVEDEAPVVSRASCVNVSRAWEGAAALAERGEEQRAYDAYMRLLGSCTNEKELVGTVYQAQKTLSAEMVAQLLVEPLMESPKLQAALFSLKLQRMYQANKSRNGKQALAVSREIRTMVLESGDAGALEVSGWLEQRARNPKVAEQLFRAALKADRDAEGARQGLVFALLAQSKVDAAAREVERLDGASADEIRAEVLLAQARQALEQDLPADTLKLLDKAERLGLNVDDSVLETRAWALKNTGQAAKASKLFVGLVDAQPDNADLVVGLVDSLAAAKDESALKKLSSGTGPVARASKEALARKLEDQGRRGDAARLRGERIEGEGSVASASMGVRSKSGDAGNGRLIETVVPTFQTDVKVNDSTRVQVEAARLRLDDGVREANGGEVRARVTKKIDNVEVTVGAGASKTANDTTPTFEGKGRVYTDSGYVEAGLKREPVRDSVRSYAGVPVEVPVAGGGNKTIRVGRVMDTNAYIGGSTVLDHLNRYNLTWQVGGGSVSGQNSPNNGYYRAEGAVMKDLQDERFSWLSVGPYASFQSYERDENRFEGAHGGYFSPKSDVNLGLQMKAMTREGERSLFKASAKAGYVSRGLFYGNDSGVAVETGVEGAWLLTDHVILGAGVALRTSPGYSDVALRFGLTIPLEKRTKLFSNDLSAFKAQQ